MLGASVNFLAVVVCGGMTSQNIIYEDAVEVDKKSLSDALTSSACMGHEEGISHIKTGESNRHVNNENHGSTREGKYTKLNVSQDLAS
jgi:predicted metal-binding protein